MRWKEGYKQNLSYLENKLNDTKFGTQCPLNGLFYNMTEYFFFF